MSEYIDKQELIETLEKNIKSANAYRMAVVVRCKDCKFVDVPVPFFENGGKNELVCIKSGLCVEDCDYCSWGEGR